MIWIYLHSNPCHLFFFSVCLRRMRIGLLIIDHDIQSISRKTSSQSACKADVSLSEATMPECLMVHMEYKKHALTIVVPIRQWRCGLDWVQHSFPFKDCTGKTTFCATTIVEVTLSSNECWIQIFFRFIILITVQDQVCFIWRSGWIINAVLWSGNTRSYDSTLGKALFCFLSATAFRTSSNPWKKNDMTSYRKTRIADLHSIKRNSRFLRHSDFTVVKSILHPLWSYSWFDLQWNKKYFWTSPLQISCGVKNLIALLGFYTEMLPGGLEKLLNIVLDPIILCKAKLPASTLQWSIYWRNAHCPICH